MRIRFMYLNVRIFRLIETMKGEGTWLCGLERLLGEEAALSSFNRVLKRDAIRQKL